MNKHVKLDTDASVRSTPYSNTQGPPLMRGTRNKPDPVSAWHAAKRSVANRSPARSPPAGDQTCLKDFGRRCGSLVQVGV